MTRSCTFLLLFFHVPWLHAQINLELLTDLSDDVKETSGLIYFDGKLITHNDSGNAAELYEIDPADGSVRKTIVLTNAVNIDWEDLAQDDDYIYIGDFGNNNGDRQDLVIYRIVKNDYLNSDTPAAEAINFSYEDQTDFTQDSQTNWDAEAFISYQGNLIIFTKQWETMGTVAYSIPNEPGTHVASRLDSYQVDGLVTGAAYDFDSDQIVLVGYSQLLFPFVVQVQNPQSDSIFSGTVVKTTLELAFSQIEGIAYAEDHFFMSSEEFTSTTPSIFSPSRLYSIQFELDPNLPQNEGSGSGLILFQPSGSQFLNYNFDTEEDIFGYAVFDVNGKRILLGNGNSEKMGSIDTSFLGSSIYFVSFYLRNGRIAKPFIIR